MTEVRDARSENDRGYVPSAFWCLRAFCVDLPAFEQQLFAFGRQHLLAHAQQDFAEHMDDQGSPNVQQKVW